MRYWKKSKREVIFGALTPSGKYRSGFMWHSPPPGARHWRMEHSGWVELRTSWLWWRKAMEVSCAAQHQADERMNDSREKVLLGLMVIKWLGEGTESGVLGLDEKGKGEVNVRMAGNQLQASLREGLMTPQLRLSRTADYILDRILYSVPHTYNI